MYGINPAMITEGTHGPQTWAGDLVAPARFRVSVSLKDAKGHHKGYGPGPTVFVATGPCSGFPESHGHERVFAGHKRVYLLPEIEPAYPTVRDFFGE